MTICESCIRNKDCKWNKGNPRHCTLYTDKEENKLRYTQIKKKTNFDRITASPEALANYFVQHHSCIGCQLKPNCEFNGIAHDCYKAMLEWLEQESK